MDAKTASSSSHDLLVAKCAAMACLFVATVLFGSIPFMLNYWLKWTDNKPNSRSSRVVQCLLYFGGGVLLATTFIHLLPEVQEVVEHLQHCQQIAETRFAVAEMLMCAGFFLMYFIEECVHSYLHRNKKKVLVKEAAAFERGHSVRNSVLVKGGRRNNAKDDSGDDSCSAKTSSTQTMEAADSVVVADNKNYLSSTLTVNTLIDPASYGKQSDLQLQTENGVHNQNHHRDHEHGHDHGHGHAHLPMDSNNDGTVTSSLRGLGIVLALSLHEVFEGLAIGLEDAPDSVWFLFGAVSAHKLVLAFCVGVELIVSRTRPILAVIYTITFAIVSPIGIAIGLGISHNSSDAEDSITSAVLQGIACGTLLYVVFFEILSKHHAGMGAFVCMLVGFGLMFGLQNIGEGHDHDDGDTCPGETIATTTTATYVELTTKLLG